MQQCDIRAFTALCDVTYLLTNFVTVVLNLVLEHKTSITRAQGRHLHDVWLKNIWKLERGQKPLKCQEKKYSVHKMQAAPPRTPLGELTALLQNP